MTTPGRRVAIVEDHGALRIFLRDTLTKLGWDVTGVAGRLRPATTSSWRPSRMSPSSTCTSLPRAAATRSSGGSPSPTRTTKLVVFTATTDPTELRGVLKAGADGIVLKEGGLPELIAGLDAVTRGERYLSPSLG